MPKRPAKKTVRKHNQSSLPLVLIGMGLIILGVAAAFLIFGKNPPPGTERQSASVVPQKVDYPAPELQLVDIAGLDVDLKDYHGQVVLLNNWATWCPPCRAEMPVL